MQLIPSIDVEGGRSRVVFWPGAAAGLGAPTDRPDRIAERFAALGAPVIHVVDFDGARRAAPANTAVLSAIAARVGRPLQVAGGVEDADAIRAVFAAGATRVVVGAAVADDPPRLAGCLGAAGEWLAIGLDARPDRLAAFPWRRPRAPTLLELARELAGAGVSRFVVGHGGGPSELDAVAELVAALPVEVVVAGGVRDLAGLRRVRDVGASGIILGEALLSGAIDYATALETIA